MRRLGTRARHALPPHHLFHCGLSEGGWVNRRFPHRAACSLFLSLFNETFVVIDSNHRRILRRLQMVSLPNWVESHERYLWADWQRVFGQRMHFSFG
jgi:hypothetical protein